MKKKRKFKEAFSEFHKDVILLTSCNIEKPLSPSERAEALGNGYGFQTVLFSKVWNSEEVHENLRNLFKEKLLNEDFEVLIPMGRKLVKPNLPPGASLEGKTLFSLFHQKIVYIRPFSIIQSDDSPNTFGKIDSPTNLNMEESATEIDSFILNTPFDEPLLEDLPMTDFPESKVETLVDQLNKFKDMISNEEITSFNVFREDIFSCYKRAVSRKKFNPLHKVSVIFTDSTDSAEGAVDMGGPTREMFRLLMKFLEGSQLFEGQPNNKNLRFSNELLEKNEYFEAGRIIVLSVIHCGFGPNFLSLSLYNFIMHGIKDVSPSINEIMDINVRSELQAVEESSNVEELRAAVNQSVLMEMAGLSFVTEFNKEHILKCALVYYVIHRIRPAIDQFIDGLNVLGFLGKMKPFFLEFKSIMCHQQSELNSTIFTEIFYPLRSEPGSNNYNKESRILAYWRDYLLDIEDGSVVTFEDVLSFATGASVIPSTGFNPMPQLQFLHNEESPFPKANTCSLILYLPMINNNYEEFKDRMDYGIQNGMVFGFA